MKIVIRICVLTFLSLLLSSYSTPPKLGKVYIEKKLVGIWVFDAPWGGFAFNGNLVNREKKLPKRAWCYAMQFQKDGTLVFYPRNGSEYLDLEGAYKGTWQVFDKNKVEIEYCGDKGIHCSYEWEILVINRKTFVHEQLSSTISTCE